MVLQPLPQPGNPCMCSGGGLVITEEEVCIQQSGMTYFVLFCWTQGALLQTKVSMLLYGCRGSSSWFACHWTPAARKGVGLRIMHALIGCVHYLTPVLPSQARMTAQSHVAPYSRLQRSK